MKNTLMKETLEDRIFTMVNYSILTLCLLAVMYPLIYVISSSFSSPYAVMAGKVKLLPVDPTLDGYMAVFKSSQVWKGYANTIWYTVVGTMINVTMTFLAAYPLSRKDFYGRQAVMIFFTFTMFFGGGLIPSFLLVRQLGLYNSRWAIIIPGAMSVWNVIITRTFFQQNIPDELLEASQLDGCSNFQSLKNVVIPLSKPVIAVITLFYAVGHWNSFFSALIYLRDSSKYPLQMVLRNILVANTIDETMINDIVDMERKQFMNELLKYALIVVATLPILIVYPFIQKHFIKGMMIGSLKG